MTDDFTKKRTLFRHPLAAVGAAIFLAGGALFLVLVLYGFTSRADNPYSALVTFVIVPFFVTLGFVLFLVSIWLQVRAARKRGEKVRFNLSIDPTDPHYMRNLWLFLGILAALIILVIYSGTEAYDATDSVAFCGKTCHTPMEPQWVTYQNSPHARVPCVECHIGPGASFYVKSKIDGIRQLWATALNTFSRPIQTPVKSLRPAQQTCETCHWPRQFYGEKLVQHTYYRTDEDNSPYTINLLVKIGGGNPRTGQQEGIHWHMVNSVKIDYVATDPKRQNIVWLRLINEKGDTVIYQKEGEKTPDFNDPTTEVRRFDCMDCHNRPSHKFLAPASALNLALSKRDISPELKYVRQEGLDLLNAAYTTRQEANDSITKGLKQYYEENYPDQAKNDSAKIEQATQTLLRIYNQNFFPEMKTDYRVRENNLTHFVNDGCFRCHDGTMKDKNGDVVPHDCRTCHLIVAEGPSENVADLQSDLTGLEFKHPEDIDQAWKEYKCTECHTPDSGY
jgi:hypothetical protein